jgi:hypothetical protein
VYQVTAEVNYAPVARAPFLIRSAADLVVSLSMNGGDEQATIRGKRFMPGIGLALIAYPMFQGGKIRVIANVKTDRRGRFGYTASTRALPAGQYELRAVSTGQLSAQMAETFFQVDI